MNCRSGWLCHPKLAGVTLSSHPLTLPWTSASNCWRTPPKNGAVGSVLQTLNSCLLQPGCLPHRLRLLPWSGARRFPSRRGLGVRFRQVHTLSYSQIIIMSLSEHLIPSTFSLVSWFNLLT